MKTPVKTIFSLFIILSLSTTSRAQDDRYDGWYKSLVKEYTLNPDGSMDYRYRKELKLLTYRAFHNLYGETFVVYDTTLQELKVNDSYTVMADGKKVTAPANAFNVVLPGFAAGAPAYNSLREMVITHTALERNATVFLDYTIHTKKDAYPAMAGIELPAENEPVQNLEIRVRVPQNKNLYYRLFNAEVRPEESSDGNYRVFTWKFSNLPAISAEESQPVTNPRYPRLVFSSSDDWENVFSVMTGQPAFSAVMTDDMRKEITAIAGDNRNRFEIALKIREMVVNDMKLYPIPLKNAFYRCRTPEQTWNSNGGTAIEKAVLLSALLNGAGIGSEVAGICRTAFTNEKVASLAYLEEVAVRVKDPEYGTWYLSVTSLNSVNLALTMPGRSFITLKPEEKPALTRSEEPALTVDVQGRFLVSSDPKLTGEISIYYEGTAYPAAGMVRDYKKMKNSLSGGFIGKDSINLKKSTLNPGNGFQTWIALNEKPFTKDSNFYYFNLPASTSGVDAWGIKTLSAKRETPFEVPAAADESYSFEIELPATLSLFTPEQKLTVSNKAGTFLWEVKADGRKATVKRQLKFNDRVFEGAAYEDFKALMDNWNNPWYRQLVLLEGKS